MSQFFEVFYRLCLEQDTTPNAVAKELGISSGAITNWKKGVEPRVSAVESIANYFGTTVDYLLGRTDDPENDDRFGLGISDDEMHDVEQLKKTPTSKGERSKDPDIRRIERAKARMPESEWSKQMKVIAASFGDYFSDDYEDDDLDE